MQREQEVMLQAIVTVLMLGLMLAAVLLGLFFVARAVIPRTSRRTTHSTNASKQIIRRNLPLIGLIIGIAIPAAIKIRLGDWEWVDMVRITAFGLMGACVGGLIDWIFSKIQAMFGR